MQLPEMDLLKFTVLPDELRNIERAVDRATALRFAAMYGGTRFSIPGYAHINSKHKLSVQFGQDVAIDIAKAFGARAAIGVAIHVPTAKDEFFARGVYFHFRMGLSADEIASELNGHRTSVFRVLKELRQGKIILEDPLGYLSDDQRRWLSTVFSQNDAPKGHDDVSNIARELQVPRSANSTTTESKTHGYEYRQFGCRVSWVPYRLQYQLRSG